VSINERSLDFFIGRLLDAAKISYTPNGSNISEIQKALKSASKAGTNNVGYPEFIGKSKDFIIVIENKADLDKQADFVCEDRAEYKTDFKSLKNFAENGAFHYAKHIVEKTGFKKNICFWMLR
jgi:hypothetical protein